MVHRPNVKPRFCFVLMPIQSSFESCYRVIKRAVKTVGLDCKRADEIYGTRRFMSDIWKSIWNARIIIADLTRKNPNVNYELGLCHALNVPTVLITQRPADVPSDYRDRRYIQYKPKEKGWNRKLAKQLRETIRATLYESDADTDIDLPWPQDATLAAYPRTGRRPSAHPHVQTVVLQDPKVPFAQGQNADFHRGVLPEDVKGFKLSIDMPREPYWRVGFALAPEDYIREGRRDIDIRRYFLFHIGRGAAARPTEPEKLRYMAYYDGNVIKHPTQFEGSDPLVLDVGFSPSRTRSVWISTSFDAVRYETEIAAAYLRYLYVLAWADNITSFRIPIRLEV